MGALGRMLVSAVNPPNCPSCSAPLDPLSTKCAYCNAVTPKGRVEAERAEYEARQRQAQQQQYAAAQASMAQALASQEVSQATTRSLIATLLGFFSCCAPVGWLGAFFAWQAISKAGKHNIPKPTGAYVALGLSLFGSITSVTVIVLSQIDAKKKEGRIATLESGVVSQRKAASLDAKTACTLAEAHFLREHVLPADGTLSCNGALAGNEKSATLDGVVVQKAGGPGTYRVCFSKGSRWYVIFADEGHADCLDEGPPAATEPEEKIARDGYAGLLEKRKVGRVEAHLAAARVAVEKASLGGEKACTEAAFERVAKRDDRGLLRAVDYALLDGKAESEFSFLSDDSLAKFSKKGTPASERQRLAGTLAGDAPLVVVYRHKTRALPELDSKAKAGPLVVPGEYDGALFVVDLVKGEIACQTPLALKSPQKPEKRSKPMADYDDEYEQAFHDLATEKIRVIGKGKLRLGYKALE